MTINVPQGMPYKYVVATESKSFRDAPPAILSALHRMDWAAKHSVIDGTLVKFNELLAVGYFEKNAMNVSKKYLFECMLLLTIMLLSGMTMARRP